MSQNEDLDWEMPLVMMSEPPSHSRPNSAPSNLRVAKRGKERVALLSEHHRRAMDCIDALQNADARQEQKSASERTRVHTRRDRARIDHGALESKYRIAPAAENPAEIDVSPSSVPPIALADSPRRELRQRHMTEAWNSEDQGRHKSTSGGAPGVTAPSRAPVAARSLVMDTSQIDCASSAQMGKVHLNANPPWNWHRQEEPREMEPDRTGDTQRQDFGDKNSEQAGQDNGLFRRKPRPPQLARRESIVSESGENTRPHTAQDSSGVQNRRKVWSGLNESERTRPAKKESFQVHVQRDIVPENRLGHRGGAWQFRSTSPGPGGGAYIRPVKNTSGQLLTSGVTYLGSSHTSLGDINIGVGGPRDLQQSQKALGLKLWPSSLRKSLWSKSTPDTGAWKLPDTGQRVRMLCQNRGLASQIFAHYAMPLCAAGGPVIVLDGFLNCLTKLEALQGSNPSVKIAMEMTGMPSLEQESAFILLSVEDATMIFEEEAAWYPSQDGDVRRSNHNGAICTQSARVLSLSPERFLECLSRVSKLLDEKMREVQDRMPMKKVGKSNRRLPLKDLRELRGIGHSRTDRSSSPKSPMAAARSPESSTHGVLHSPLASISAMSREIADPTAKQAALFKALKAKTVTTQYQRLARQVARETMVQIDAAVKSKTKTRKELEWLLVLRDQALTSLGLIVTQEQIRAAAEAGENADGNYFDDANDPLKAVGDGEEQQMLPWRGPPAWAWVVPSDTHKPISPVMDGWYLVSGDPGPQLRLVGPLPQRSRCIKAVADFKPLAITVFNIMLIRDSAVIETFCYDTSGRPIQVKAAAIENADGWYVVMYKAEKRQWTLRLECNQLDKEIQVLKKVATQARKTLRQIQESLLARKENLATSGGSKRPQSRDFSLSQQLFEEVQHTITEEDMSAAKAQDAVAMEKWKTALLKKRELETELEAAEEEVKLGRSDLETVEGPMSLEIMAQQYILNKKSKRVRQALRVVHIEKQTVEMTDWRPE